MRIPIYLLQAHVDHFDIAFRLKGIIAVTIIVGGIYFLMYVNSMKYLKIMNDGFAPNVIAKLINFWNSYSQLILSVFIAYVITLLLLVEAISAEAGLPILSAISGFAIAKAPSSREGGDISTPPPHSSPDNTKPDNSKSPNPSSSISDIYNDYIPSIKDDDDASSAANVEESSAKKYNTFDDVNNL